MVLRQPLPLPLLRNLQRLRRCPRATNVRLVPLVVRTPASLPRLRRPHCLQPAVQVPRDLFDLTCLLSNARRGGVEKAFEAGRSLGMDSLIDDLGEDHEAASGRGVRASHLATWTKFHHRSRDEN